MFRLVECCKCGVMIRRKSHRTRVVRIIRDFMHIDDGHSETYCSRCAPPYDRVRISSQGKVCYKVVKEHLVVVPEDGEPIDD